MTEREREKWKRFKFVYWCGIREGQLAKNLKLTAEECSALVKRFKEQYPEAEAYMRSLLSRPAPTGAAEAVANMAEQGEGRMMIYNEVRPLEDDDADWEP